MKNTMYNSPLYFSCMQINGFKDNTKTPRCTFMWSHTCTLLVFKRVIHLRSNIVVSLKNGSELFEEQPLQYSTSIPIHKMRYDLHPPFSKDVAVHTAYFDQRPRDNHVNVTVIFLNINKTIMDNGWVVGCGVDGRNTAAFSLYSVFENELMHNWLGKKPFKYENMEVLCYDMPGKNGSEVFVVYKTAQNSHEIREISQYPLYIPAPRVSPIGEYNFTTVTCTKINDRRKLRAKNFYFLNA